MISFMVLDTEFRSYNRFDTEEEAREYIRDQVKQGVNVDIFRLFRRQELEIAQ